MNTSHAKITVVIPLYNKEKHIIRTIDSILSQHTPAAEIIVVNDGSTDDGVRTLLQERGDYVRIINQKNQGVSAARNTGIRESRYDFVAFIDADDTWEPHFLQEINSLISNFPSANCYATNYQVVHEGGQFVDPKVRWDFIPTSPRVLTDFFELGSKGELPFQMSSFCIKKDAIKRIGYFPLGEPMGEDQEFFIKSAITGDIAFSPRVLSFYFKDAENRACLRHTPTEECPFSRRLHTWALNHESKADRKELMIDFTAAHILHLASQNIKARNLKSAKLLLSDYRCKRHFTRYVWWRVNLTFQQILTFFYNTQTN